MTDYTTEENLLNFVGPTSILLQDTIHLFKKNYWYKIEYTIDSIISTCTMNISDYSFVEDSIGYKKYIFKITDDLTTNYIQFELDTNSAVSISNLKIDIFGLVEFGINRNDLPKVFSKYRIKLKIFHSTSQMTKKPLKNLFTGMELL